MKKNLIGRRFGRLVVVAESPERKHGRKTWICRCDCGNETAVIDTSLGKATNSCGCLRRERAAGLNLKHGMHKDRLYRIWGNMRGRCCNPKHKSFVHYGNRGIEVCTEWDSDFKSFADWALSNGYADDLTIDRIDVNGNYEPSNCRWATMKEQQNNRTDSHFVTYNGETKTITEWANCLGVRPDVIFCRLQRGWSKELAVSTPNLGKNGRLDALQKGV